MVARGVLLMLLAVPSVAAAGPAVSFSYRALVGASVRLEHAVGPMTMLEEVGASGWIVYGDDPTGGQPSPLLLRTHAKLGLDVALSQPRDGDHWYIGPRIVGAHHFSTLDDVQEGAIQGVVGRKIENDGLRWVLGAGLGYHVLWRAADDFLTVPLPHVELRLGPAPRSVGPREDG